MIVSHVGDISIMRRDEESCGEWMERGGRGGTPGDCLSGLTKRQIAVNFLKETVRRPVGLWAEMKLVCAMVGVGILSSRFH